MRIVPLDICNVEYASRLADEIFSYVSPFPPSVAFKASLDPELYRALLKTRDVVRFHYWLAINEVDQSVMGTTGLYELAEDQNEASWLGWFCVAPTARGQGVGQKILDFTLQLATILGKKYLRLYTSTHPNEKNAQFLYEKNSFRIYKIKEKVNGSKVLYREKILGPIVLEPPAILIPV